MTHLLVKLFFRAFVQEFPVCGSQQNPFRGTL